MQLAWKSAGNHRAPLGSTLTKYDRIQAVDVLRTSIDDASSSNPPMSLRWRPAAPTRCRCRPANYRLLFPAIA